jgi:hypothetical protein
MNQALYAHMNNKRKMKKKKKKKEDGGLRQALGKSMRPYLKKDLHE